MKVCCIFNIAPSYRKAIYELMQTELDVDFFCGDRSADGIALLPMNNELSNVYKGKKLIWQKGAIRRAFAKKYDAHILTGNAGIRSNWIIALLARLTGRKVYLWTHGLKGNENRSDLFKNLLYMRLAGNALLYGEKAQKRLAEHGFTRTTVIYNSLDYDNQLAIRNRVCNDTFLQDYFNNNLPVICFLGRVNAAKRIDMLLEAIKETDCNLIIVGSGPEEKKLRKMSMEFGIAHKIWFYGECYDDVIIGNILKNCLATVNPSSIGLTAIHSLMFGTPVITHDDLISQAPEAEVIIEGVTGYYYRKGSTESLRQTIHKAINNQKQSEACYEVIEKKYNPHVQIEILKGIFGSRKQANAINRV